MFAQSLNSRQRRPWKSSSSQSVRLAGVGPGAGALLMPLRARRAGPKVQRPARPMPAQPGWGVNTGLDPGCWRLSLTSSSPARRRPCPSPEYSPGGVSAVLTENGEAARGPGVRGFIPGLAPLSAFSPPGMGELSQRAG